ncbi:cytoplasmic tRNA 2-thiolation protein 2 [Gastrophryne carolinensis]
MKCKEASAVLIIRVGDAFCRSCFKEYFVHKFRAMLGKNRVVYPGEKVLLAYSGGPSSSAMIQQVQEGLSRNAPKKLRFIPAILFIDEGAVFGQSWEDREQVLYEIHSILKATSFPFHIVPLEELFCLPPSVLQMAFPENSEQSGNYKQLVGSFLEQQSAPVEDAISGVAERLGQMSSADAMSPECSDFLTLCRPPAEHTTALIRMFNSAKTMTAKQELLHTLRGHLILHVARKYGYSKVMSGESCTRLAVNLLANISLGRGAFLALDTGFSDTRFGDVVIVRPMRDYSMKEISFYNRLFNVSSVFISSLDTKASGNSSIQHLSETFITKLQADFPSTVSTVYRTSEKLNSSKKEATQETNEQEKCLLCMCSADTHTGSSPKSFCPLNESNVRLLGREDWCLFGRDLQSSNVVITPDLPHIFVLNYCLQHISPLVEGYYLQLPIHKNSLETLPSYILKEAEKRLCRGLQLAHQAFVDCGDRLLKVRLSNNPLHLRHRYPWIFSMELGLQGMSELQVTKEIPVGKMVCHKDKVKSRRVSPLLVDTGPQYCTWKNRLLYSMQMITVDVRPVRQ